MNVVDDGTPASQGKQPECPFLALYESSTHRMCQCPSLVSISKDPSCSLSSPINVSTEDDHQSAETQANIRW